MFRSQQIIIREYVCTSLKLLNYLKNTEFKILKIIPGVVAAKCVAGIRGDPCGAVHSRGEQRLEAAQIKLLRHLLGITKLDKEKNQ